MKYIKSSFFRYTALAGLVACAFAFMPQILALFDLSTNQNIVGAYCRAGYRLLLPFSASLTAWRFGVRRGLLTCLVFGSAIILASIINTQFPNIVIDIINVALSIFLSWLIGRQGSMKQSLQETAAKLEKQSELLKQEILERKNAEEQYKLIADYSADIIYKISLKEERFNYVSPSVKKILGYTQGQALSIKLTDLLTPQSYNKQNSELMKDLRNGVTSSTLQLEIIHKDGYTVPFEVHSSLVFNEKGEPSEIVGVARDITERKKMEEQLIGQDRLASIGQLTSGLAHELNNPLTSIISLSSLLQRENLSDDIRQDIMVINDEAYRIAGMVKNLLTFSRKHPQEKQLTDINESITKVLEMRAYEQSINNIKVNMELAPDLPAIMGNSPQLEQVFFNLVINAEYFMIQSHRKGCLCVKTENCGEYIRASFTDDGPGISEDNLKRLFTPFFTTKEVGKGTGLSLSICLGIINDHNGRIYAQSRLGAGATFIVELPLDGQYRDP